MRIRYCFFVFDELDLQLHRLLQEVGQQLFSETDQPIYPSEFQPLAVFKEAGHSHQIAPSFDHKLSAFGRQMVVEDAGHKATNNLVLRNCYWLLLAKAFKIL